MATDIKPYYWKVKLPNETIYVQAVSVEFSETHVIFKSSVYSSGISFSEVSEAFQADRILHLKRMPDGFEG